METFKPTFPIRGRAALLATACLVVPVVAGEPFRGLDAAQQELSRRSASIEEAQELLRKGDEAYQAGRYDEAVEAFAGARELIPNAPVSSELRAAATERYAQASVEKARVLSRTGDLAGAKATIDLVLQKDVAPNHAAALAFRSQLDDPIRTNPALTAEHAKNVDSVRQLLYTAEGAYNLGKFDEADRHYKDVLRIDPFNAAARRGMEKVASAKSRYQGAAYDDTRAEMLSQVEAQWELKPAPVESTLDLGPTDGSSGAASISVSAKLERIIIPRLALDQASLEEALDFLRVQAAEHDTLELDPAQKGVNFTVNLGPPESEIAQRIRNLRFDLQLTQVPLSQALKYLTDLTQTAYTTDDFSVIITPLGSTSEELLTRTYHVPPDFLTSLSSGAEASQEPEDPFGEAPASGGLLTQRLSVQEALANQGVKFPDGASASYNAATNTLRVTNTSTNQDFISQIVETMAQTEPVMVAVRVTMIKTEQTNLEELGFDWLIGPFGNSGSNVFGSGGTTGNSQGRTGGDFISPVDFTTIPGAPSDPSALASNVVTNGLRSGDGTFTEDSIDSIINNPNRFAQSSAVAPGIMALTGLFSDGQAQMIMRGLSQKKGVDVMAKPTTVTRSGQSSTIEIVREFIYATEYEPPELPNSIGVDQVITLVGGTGGSNTLGGTPVTPATPTAFETKKVGITLEVLPVVDANKKNIEITLNPSISDFEGFVNYGSPITEASQNALGESSPVTVTENRILMPVFSSQKTSTQLTVADGSTIVMGGLMRDGIQTVNDKVPVLGDLPMVGRLFQTKATKPISSVVIFLVNVELLDPTGRPYRDR